MNAKGPIGVFDSGVGGLTVYRGLRAVLPHEDFIYLGDSARLPYGIKSRAVVESYTLEAAQLLTARGIKFFVIACNTVSAQAMQVVQKNFPGLACCGVITAGAEEAAKASRNGKIAVLATEGTVRSAMYPDMIRALRRDADVQMLACADMVTLAEKGKIDGAEAEAIVARYMAMLQPGYDTLVLGCTHFPLLLKLIQKQTQAQIIDSATATAQSVVGFLTARDALNPQTEPGQDHFVVTAEKERFAQLGTQFLGFDIAGKVELAGLAAFLDNRAE